MQTKKLHVGWIILVLILMLSLFTTALTWENISEVYSDFSFVENYSLLQHNATEWWFYDNVTNLTDGAYTWYHWANDTAGNEGVSETRVVGIGEGGLCKTHTSSFTIDENFSVSGDCIIIGANDITANCQGYTITGNKSGTGINITYYNDTILTNCTVTNFSKQIFAYDVANISFVDSKSLDAHFYNATGVYVDLDYTNCKYAFRNAKIQSNSDWDNCNFNITLPQSRVVHVTSYESKNISYNTIIAFGSGGLSLLMYVYYRWRRRRRR